jgi:hypothetical protein
MQCRCFLIGITRAQAFPIAGNGAIYLWTSMQKTALARHDIPRDRNLGRDQAPDR